MGFLNNILKNIKKYTLDKTDLDEKIGSKLSSIGKSGKNFFTSKIAPSIKANIEFRPRTSSYSATQLPRDIYKYAVPKIPYIKNRYIDPIKKGIESLSKIQNEQSPYTTIQALKQKKTPQQITKTKANPTDILNSIALGATLFPDPIGDIGLPAFDALKGYSASSLRGGNLKENLKSAKEALTLEKPVGLGEAFFKDENTQTALNIAELPLTMLLVGKLNAKSVNNVDNVESVLVNIAKKARTEKEYLTGVKSILENPKYAKYAERLAKSNVEPVSVFGKVKPKLVQSKIKQVDFMSKPLENRTMAIGQSLPSSRAELESKTPSIKPLIKVEGGEVKNKIVNAFARQGKKTFKLEETKVLDYVIEKLGEKKVNQIFRESGMNANKPLGITKFWELVEKELGKSGFIKQANDSLIKYVDEQLGTTKQVAKAPEGGTKLPKGAVVDKDGLRYTYKGRSYPFLTGNETSDIKLTPEELAIANPINEAFGFTTPTRPKVVQAPEGGVGKTTKISSLNHLEVELPVAKAVESTANEGSVSSGFHESLNKKWTIVYKEPSQKLINAAKEAGLEVTTREAPKGSGQILTDISLADVGAKETNKATKAFNKFADLYNKPPTKPNVVQALEGGYKAHGFTREYNDMFDGWDYYLKDKNIDIKDAQTKIVNFAKENDYNLKANPDGTIKLYHGTTKENANKVLKNGFDPNVLFGSPGTEKFYGGVNGAKYYGDSILSFDADPRDLIYRTEGEFYINDASNVKNIKSFSPAKSSQVVQAPLDDISALKIKRKKLLEEYLKNKKIRDNANDKLLFYTNRKGNKNFDAKKEQFYNTQYRITQNRGKKLWEEIEGIDFDIKDITSSKSIPQAPLDDIAKKAGGITSGKSGPQQESIPYAEREYYHGLTGRRLQEYLKTGEIPKAQQAFGGKFSITDDFDTAKSFVGNDGIVIKVKPKKGIGISYGESMGKPIDDITDIGESEFLVSGNYAIEKVPLDDISASKFIKDKGLDPSSVMIKNDKNMIVENSAGRDAILKEIPIEDFGKPKFETSAKYKSGRKITAPIEATLLPNGKYRITDGANRFSQAVANGDKTIPTIVEVGGKTIKVQGIRGAVEVGLPQNLATKADELATIPKTQLQTPLDDIVKKSDEAMESLIKTEPGIPEKPLYDIPSGPKKPLKSVFDTPVSIEDGAKKLNSFISKKDIKTADEAASEFQRFQDFHLRVGEIIKQESSKYNINKVDLTDILQGIKKAPKGFENIIKQVRQYTDNLRLFRENLTLGDIGDSQKVYLQWFEKNGIYNESQKIIEGTNIWLPENVLDLGSTKTRTGALEKTHLKDFDDVWKRMGEEAGYDKYQNSFYNTPKKLSFIDEIKNRLKPNKSGSVKPPSSDFNYVEKSAIANEVTKKTKINYKGHGLGEERFQLMYEGFKRENPELAKSTAKVRDGWDDFNILRESVLTLSPQEWSKKVVDELGLPKERTRAIESTLNRLNKDSDKLLFSNNLTKGMIQKRIQNFIDTVGKYEFNPRVEKYLNEQIDRLTKVNQYSNNLYTKAVNIATGLTYRAQIWANVSVALQQKMETTRLAALYDTDVIKQSVKQRASDFKNGRDIVKEYGFKATDYKQIVSQFSGAKKGGPSIIGIVDEKLGKVGNFMVEFMENSKNADFLTAAEIQGKKLGLSEDALRTYVRDELFTNGYILHKFNTPELLQKSATARLALQYSQYFFKDIRKMVDAVVVEKNKPLAYKLLASKTLQLVLVAGLTGTGWSGLKRVGLPIGLGPAITAVYSAGKAIFDAKAEEEASKADPAFDPTYARDTLSQNLKDIFTRNAVPFGVQALKSKRAFDIQNQGFATTKQGRITYKTSDNPLVKAQTMVFGPSVDKESKNYYSKEGGVLNTGQSLGPLDKYLGIPPTRNKYYSINEPRSDYIKNQFKSGDVEGGRKSIDIEHNKQDVMKQFNSSLTDTEKEIYKEFYPTQKKDNEGNIIPFFDTQAQSAHAKWMNPEILLKLTNTQKQIAKETGLPLNPFYNISPQQQATVLRLQTLPPGSPDKKDLQNANMEWLADYWAEQGIYDKEAKKLGLRTENPYYDAQRITPSPELQAKLDFYNTLPKGTGARSAFLNANPDVLEFFQASQNLTNLKRTFLGLLPIESNQYGSGGSGFDYKDYYARKNLSELMKTTAGKSSSSTKLKKLLELGKPTGESNTSLNKLAQLLKASESSIKKGPTFKKQPVKNVIKIK